MRDRSVFGWRRVSLAVVAAVGLAGPLQSAQQEVFTDDFERPDGPVQGWTTFSGAWAIATGQMTTTATGVESDIWLGEPGANIQVTGDLEIQADVSFGQPAPALPVGRHGGFIFFASAVGNRGAPQSGYEMDWIDRKDDGVYNDYGFRLIRIDNGVGTVLLNDTADLPEVPLVWKIQVDGDQIRILGDDNLVIEVTDGTYRRGYVGAWAYQNGTQMFLDNFQMTYFPVVMEPCFTTSATIGAAPFPVDFDATCTTSVNGVEAYEWDFGDGEVGTGATITHEYLFGGSYMVTLTVRDTQGNTDTATTTITVWDSRPTFSDDFSRPDGPVDGWTVWSGSWNIVSEQLTTTTAGGENWAWAGDPPYSFPANFTLTFYMNFSVRPADDVGRHGGVMFCATRPTHRYDAAISGYTIDWIDRLADHGIRLLRVTNGVQQVLANGARDPSLYPDPPLEWEIVVEGPEIRVFGDGVLLLQASDSTYRRGLFGAWGWSNGQQIIFDDMDVSSPAVNPCFEVSPSAAVELGTELTFDASCSTATGTPIQTWAWDFGDGDTAQGKVVTHTYATAGVRTATLTITTQGALSATWERTVEAYVPLESFADDFERPDGSPSGWTPLTDNWALSGGTLQATVETAGIDVWCYAGDPPQRFRNFQTIEFDMEFLSEAPANTAAVGRHAGVFFFAESPNPRGALQNDGYGIDWIDRIDDHGYRIYRFDNGVQTTLLNGTPSEVDPGTRWTIELDGDLIRLLVDGELKGEVTDATYRMGHFAFWAYGGDPTTAWVQQVQFDNLVIGEGVVPPTGFRRGDANSDGSVNITDGIYILNFLFLGGETPTCIEAANPNDDDAVNITDGIYVLNFLFLGGAAPTDPGNETCGPDPAASINDLGCEAYGAEC